MEHVHRRTSFDAAPFYRGVSFREHRQARAQSTFPGEAAEPQPWVSCRSLAISAHQTHVFGCSAASCCGTGPGRAAAQQTAELKRQPLFLISWGLPAPVRQSRFVRNFAGPSPASCSQPTAPAFPTLTSCAPALGKRTRGKPFTGDRLVANCTLSELWRGRSRSQPTGSEEPRKFPFLITPDPLISQPS